MRNGTGQFGPGRGPGTYSFTIPGSGGPGTRINITSGSNQFGGTMRLLGAIGATRAHALRNKTFVGTVSKSFGVIGGGCAEMACPAAVGTSTTTQIQYKSGMGNATTATITARGFPWTTGTVSVTAPAGPFPTVFKRKGFDNRTPNGAGTIQLVAPQLAKWTFPNRDAPWDRHTGAIGILRIKFIPEPSGGAMFVAGAALFGLFCRLRARDQRRASRHRWCSLFRN